MAITMDGIFVNGQQVTFAPENILTGDASAYTQEIGTSVGVTDANCYLAQKIATQAIKFPYGEE